MSIDLDYMLYHVLQLHVITIYNIYFKCIIVQQDYVTIVIVLCYHSDNDSKRRKRMSPLLYPINYLIKNIDFVCVFTMSENVSTTNRDYLTYHDFSQT